MANIFSFINFDKEGPGIEKNAPKKKTFIVFFETFFRNFFKFVNLNLVYSIISLPIITNGIANAGLTNVTRNIARDKHSFGLSDFFETIKKNLLQSVIVGIINTLITMFFLFDIWYFYNVEGIASSIGLGITISFLFIFTCMNFYIWTLMITFSFSVKALYKNSFKFVFLNMKKNIICFLGIVLVYGIYLLIPYVIGKYWLMALTVELLVYIATFPCFKLLMVQYCAFPAIKKYIIDPYYKEHPFDDIQKRKDLGLEIEEEKALEEESTEETEEN